MTGCFYKSVAEAELEEMALLLEAFTADVNLMPLYTSLKIAAREHCIATYFLPNGAIPPPEHAALVGLPAGKSFFSR